MSKAATIELAEDAAPAGKKSGKGKLILIVAPVVVLLLVVAGLWFSGILPHLLGGGKPKHPVAAMDEKPSLLDVPDVVTNLDTGTHRAIFVKLRAKIEVAHAAENAVVTSNMPRILDAFQTYLRSTRPEELHGGEGTYRLREALINRIDSIVAPVQILDVLFVEVLVQ
nr:flagellar basal body-associated FliL family protein [uncultured Lichenicoccus sp.]